ncbi:MAG: AAA family ATPase, partial [Butyricicoccaceae bacterium]
MMKAEKARVRCARYCGFGVLDEINMAKNEALAVLHATLDFRRSIDVPGYDRLDVDPAARFIGTMNYGYAGTRELNEALTSCFAVIQVPAIDGGNLERLLTKEFPSLEKKYREQFVQLFLDLQKKCENAEISSKALDLRGMLDALRLIQKGLSAGTALDMGITNKAFDSYEQGLIRDIIAARIPANWTVPACLPTDMETSAYSARQRRAINQIWTACGDYRFEPQFLAMRSDGQPDLYMNCVIGLVHKWFGEDLSKKLFTSWAGDAHQAMYDDLAWLALENAVYEKELPERPALAGLQQAHAVAFFASEYQLSRQEWMAKNQLVYALQSARWKAVLGQKPPVLAPWEKGLSAALSCPGTLSGEELTEAVRTAFR